MKRGPTRPFRREHAIAFRALARWLSSVTMNVVGGDVNDQRIAGERVGQWDDAYGVIEYDDPSGARYRCRWNIVMIGDRRSAEVTSYGLRDDVPDPEPPEPLAPAS